MTEHRIIGHAELRAEMGAVARGERPAPADAGRTSFNSVEALTRLLTPENRQLLATIRAADDCSSLQVGSDHSLP